MLPEQEGTLMFSADLSTRGHAGHAVVTPGGELDVMDAEFRAGAPVTVRPA